ncbi:MAG TPA: tetratricopeptide repeat protein [Vicinamibacterales bacterium]
MKLESAVFAVAGMCFGIILGWVIGTQQARTSGAATPPPAAQASAAAGTTQRQAPPLDEAKVQSLTTILKSDPNNASATLQLANAYFDAERFTDAIEWYERTVKLDPKNVDANTDLGVSYYYESRADEALATFERSLQMDPKHTKTLLNKGIVLAFGKEDLKAAAVEWQKVVELAPSSPEGETARRALEGVAAAHAGGAAGAAGAQQ